MTFNKTVGLVHGRRLKKKKKKKRNKSTFNDEKKNVKFQPKNFAKFLSGVDMSRGFFKMQIEL